MANMKAFLLTIFVTTCLGHVAGMVPADTVISVTLNNETQEFSLEDFTQLLAGFQSKANSSCFNEDGTPCASALVSNDSFARFEMDSNIFWLLFGTVLVFFMHSGFTMLELGSVSIKNSKNIIVKNLSAGTIAALCFWSFGYSFALVGGNSFIGWGGFFLSGDTFYDVSSYLPGAQYNGYAFALWVFQWAFAATASTIVSGAVAERVTFFAYICYTVALTIFIYPVIAHWGWSGTGWASAWKGDINDQLFDAGVIDFAGSGVVHMTGGMAALVGVYFIGPRRGRYDNNGVAVDLPQQSVPFQSMGTLFLWFGWYGFNCVSTLAITGGLGDVAAKVAVNTTIAAAAGGATAVILGKVLGVGSHGWIRTTAIDPQLGNNGILSGLVGVTAGCSTVQPSMAFVIGIVAGIIYFFSSRLLVRLKLDDVVDAVPVHLCNGMWGVLAAGLFATKSNYIAAYGDYGEQTPCGLVWGGCNGNGGKQFAANLVFALSIIAWVGGTSIVVFGVLKMFKVLRVPPEHEERGLDHSEHGGHAYEIYENISVVKTAGKCLQEIIEAGELSGDDDTDNTSGDGSFNPLTSPLNIVDLEDGKVHGRANHL